MKAVTVFLLCLFAAAGNSQGQDYYYVCSYAQPHWGTDILFSKIDLDKKEIVLSREIPITGYISLEVPPKIEHESRPHFFLATVYGLWGHNAPAGLQYAHFAVVDGAGRILQIDSLRNTFFLHSVDSLEAGVVFDDSTRARIIASLSMNSDSKVVFNKIGEERYRDEDYPVIEGFRYFKRIAPDNDSVFWNIADNGNYILLLDVANEILIDSLNISTRAGYSCLFGLSEDNSTVYVFYVDCFCKGWRDPTELGSIAPSYLKRYSAADLSLIDSLYIPNPCTDSICLNHFWGTCDRIGNYMVYFYFETAHVEAYPPALLFIFDTRTNEASWLRVGWR
jgi:hypothetical protein